MRNTTNLNLPIIEDEDSLALMYTQCNTTNEILDTTFDGYKDIPQTLENLQTNINSVNSEITAINKKVADTEKSIVLLEEKMSNVEVEVDGVTKKGKMKRLVIKDTPTYSNFSKLIPLINTENNTIYDVNATRCLITNDSGYGNINMTELIGLRNVKDILLLSAQLYSDEYISLTSGKSNTIPLDCYSLQKLTFPGANEDIYLSYSGSKANFTVQNYISSTSGGWQPSITPAIPTSEVYIVLSYIEFNK